MTDFVQVYGMGDEESRDVLVRPAMSPERRASLDIPMTNARLLRGYTMRRDRLADLRAVCDYKRIGFAYAPDVPKWNNDECRAGWGRIKRNADAMREDLIQFVLSEGWKACGYKTFEEQCDAELYGMRFPSIEARREAVKEFTEAGVPTKAISTAFGQDRRTTYRDQRASGATPPLPRRPGLSTSRDGTNVPSAQHDVVQSHVIEVEQERWVAPKRDAAHLMAYQEGLTDTPPPPDLRCFEDVIRVLRTGEDHPPADVLITLYGLVRSTLTRYGITTQREEAP
jgi:hypothetical protein